jgi:hypothetical protein
VGSAAVVQQVTWEEALSAGRILFGTRAEALLAGSAWRDELKRAYKRRVLETHPDRAKALGRGEAELSREFRAVADAYRLLQDVPDAGGWLRAHPPPAARRSPSRSAAAEAARARQQAEARARRQADAWARSQAEARARQEAEVRRAEHARMAEEARQARQREEERRARARRAAAEAPRPPPRAADWRHVVKPRPMPRRRVRLAEFLYYSGRISWAVMVEAIAWQRRQRPAVGRIAVDFGFLTPLEVIDVIARRQRAGAHDVPFGEFALRLGMITPFERLAMVGRQVRLQRPIGQYFVERGILGEHEFDELRRQIVRHNLRHYA